MAGPGLHIWLSREDAKRLFALQDDEEVREFVQELARAPRCRKNDQVLESGSAWDPIHRCLTDGALDPEGGEFPLNHCILGGRQLYRGDDFIAALVRPDVAAHVAEALARIKRDTFRERYFNLDPHDYGRTPSEEEYTEVWIAFRQIRDFYAFAGDERYAVLFAAEL